MMSVWRRLPAIISVGLAAVAYIGITVKYANFLPARATLVYTGPLTSQKVDNTTAPQCQTITNATSHQDMCRCLPHWLASSQGTEGSSGLAASDLWNTHQDQIREAALMSTQACWQDDSWKSLNHGLFHQFTKDLFRALNVYRLGRSMKTPSNPYATRQVAQIILDRIKDPVNNPPLKVAVFGGSVTQGVAAQRNIYGLKLHGLKDISECSWTRKLQDVVNHILGQQNNEQIIVVKNFAFGGIDSDIGSTLLAFNLWPEPESKGADFDVIVNAFSSNDAKAETAQLDILDDARQRFVRLALDQRPCSPLPLVIQLEDGMMETFNSREGVYTGLRYSRDMVQSAAWAGIMSVSYADAIREMIYANTTSRLLDEFGNLHPGQGFHTG